LLELMEQDCEAVNALIPALSLPRGVYTPGTEGSSTVQTMLADATWSPVGVLKVATRLLELTEELALQH
jgi:formiminotetrahydrofolate cyclodeaminase